MKKTLYILLALAFILGSYSCDDPVDFRRGNETEKIVVESVISPGAKLNFTKLTSSIVVNASVQNLDLTEIADVIISDNVTKIELDSRIPEGVNCDAQDGCYAHDGSSLEEGRIYDFSASISDSDMLDVSASTKIPYSNTFESIEQVELDTIYDADDNSKYGLRFEYSIVINEPVEFPAFYRLIPMIRDFGRDINGEFYVKSPEIFYFDNFDFTIGGNASHVLEHREGLLINQSKLEGNRLVLSFETSTTLNLNEDFVPRVNFRLQAVHEDYYRYFLSSSRQIKSALSGSVQPIANYTNISYGYGVFSSFSETQDSISIN